MKIVARQYLIAIPALLTVLACGKKANEPSQSAPTQPVPVMADSSAAKTPIPALKRSLKDFEYRLSEGMTLSSSEEIPDGPFKGFTKNVYKAGAGAKALVGLEIITKDGKVYRETTVGSKPVMDSIANSNPKAPAKDVLSFFYSSSFYQDDLYAIAFDINYKPGTAPDELVKDADSFAAMCVENVHYKPGGTYYQVNNGYAFGCLNTANKTISFDVVSEDVYKDEKMQRVRGGK